jgi:AcrR family transcriptional regulator
MAARSDPRTVAAGDRWAGRIAALNGEGTAPRRREPITVERIVAAALALVEAEGFDALTMRRVAAALKTGPASLYAHVRDKADLADLLIGELCVAVVLPAPDPAGWMTQFKDVCGQLRDQYLGYPGISRAAFVAAPRNLDALRVSEGLLAIVLAAGVPAQRATWAVDAALLYVGAYSLEASLRQQPGLNDGGRPFNRAELAERLRMLPESHFPNTVAYVNEITAGEGHERFDFTLDLLLRSLVAPGE